MHEQFKPSSSPNRCGPGNAELYPVHRGKGFDLFLRQFFDADISKTDRPMVALKEYRPGNIHLVVELTAGWLVAQDIVVDFDAV